MVFISESTKQVVLLELAVPWKDWIEGANKRKRAKYADLVTECWSNGWRAHSEPVKVGHGAFIRAKSQIMSLGHKLGADYPWLGCLGDDLKPETPYDSGFITEVVSK